MEQKKASIGATMTWVVATIIIFVVIIIFVYASSLMVASKSSSGIIPSDFIARARDVQTQQTLLAVLETELDKNQVKNYILNGDYEGLEPRLRPLLEHLPGTESEVFSTGMGGGISYCVWSFSLYSGDKKELNVGLSSNPDITSSIVYINDKKAVLDKKCKTTVI